MTLYISSNNSMISFKLVRLIYPRLAKSTENKMLSSQKIKHENKLKDINNIDNQIVEPRMSCEPEKSIEELN